MAKRRKILVKEREVILFSNDYTAVLMEEDGNLYFESGNFLTQDVAEGVAFLMRKDPYGKNTDLWNINIEDVDRYQISPEKAIYWLSGGDTEWICGNHYKYSWSESCNIFADHYSDMIHSIVNKSKTLNDIRIKFIKYLNLPTLYETAVNNNLIK